MPKLRELDANERMVTQFLNLCHEDKILVGIDTSVAGFDATEYEVIRKIKQADAAFMAARASGAMTGSEVDRTYKVGIR